MKFSFPSFVPFVEARLSLVDPKALTRDEDGQSVCGESNRRLALKKRRFCVDNFIREEIELLFLFRRFRENHIYF